MVSAVVIKCEFSYNFYILLKLKLLESCQIIDINWGEYIGRGTC